MSKKKHKDRLNLVGYDPIETPEEIISSDKNIDRKEAFKEAYKKVMLIVPDYFLKKKKKKKQGSGSSSSGGNSFAQNIIVTPEIAKIETNGALKQEDRDEEREK